MLNPEALARLKGRKNLLAFSGGVDSTALFFLLLEAGVPFDIAHVNYHTRPQSDAEAAHAEALAEKHKKRCFLFDATVGDRNFEHEARKVRYDFFGSLIASEQYDNLITAHQCDDRLEWLLMQLCKGAGLPEMLGMRSVEELGRYTLVRPLLQQSKADLRRYLEENGHLFFEDESNDDESYRRNYFRRRFSGPMMERFQSGIRNSLDFLDEDLQALLDAGDVHRVEALYYFATPSNRRSALYTIDQTLKKCGFLMRQGDRQRLKQDDTAVVGRNYVVAIGKSHTFIAPYTEAVMDKPFKERCRSLGIEPKLRPYLYGAPEAYEKVCSLLRDAVDLHGE